MTERPLSNVRVLDFGQYIAGPLVGMILADFGAEVIRIDPPGGPRMKSPAVNMLSRGKQALTLDLKSPEGCKTALELITWADVVIENFRPGVMEKLGLGPQKLLSINPNIIVLSLPGFASNDSELANIAAWEGVIAARTGQFTDMGLNRILMGINPSFTPLTLASAYGASFGAMSVLFALNSREKFGGDHIEVPLASALLEGLSYNCERIENYPARYKSPRELEIDRRKLQKLPMNLTFEEMSEFLDPFYRTYECADGRGFYMLACSVSRHPKRALQLLGLNKLADTLPDFDAYLDQTNWPDSWSIRNYPVGEADRKRIADAIKAAFLTRTSFEWEEIFGEGKVPGFAQRSSQEWMADSHANSSGLILSVFDHEFGEMRQMGNVAWISDDPDSTRKQPAPKPNSAKNKLAEILNEPPKNFTKSQNSKTSWLEDLKVLDLTNVIAGPTIGSTLARFGAEVISVQPVEPSVDPWNTVVFGVQAQRGKRSILINLKTSRGQDILTDLIANSDVITMNGTDKQRESLQLTEKRIKGINPNAILVQLDALGGPKVGSKSNYLGYDDLAQAATGVMVRFGGGLNTPEEHAHFGTIDVLTGYCGCIALGAAMYNLKQSGHTGIARTSLSAAGNMIQAYFMYDFENRPPFNEPSGRKVLGWGPFYHCYQTKDQWVFLASPTEGKMQLSNLPEFADINDIVEESLIDELSNRFSKLTYDYLSSAFNGTSSAIIPLGSLHKTRDDALKLESEDKINLEQGTFCVVRHDTHPMGRWVDLVAPNSVRSKNSKIKIPSPAPKYGADTREILKQLGYNSEQINEMITAKIVGLKWSDNYLPE